MFSISRPRRRLKLVALAAVTVGAGVLALAGAVQASADDLGPFTCADRSGGVAGAAGTVTAIRIAHHAAYDRFVIGFATSNAMPSYRLTRQANAQFVRDPSGLRVTLEGSASLGVVLQNTDINAGVPNDLTPRLPEIREETKIGDFERVTSYGVGLATAACVRVLELSGPTRLVIDVATPATASPAAQPAVPGALAATGHPADPARPSSLPVIAFVLAVLAMAGGTALVAGRRVARR